MLRCKRCLLPPTRPDTFFNEEGVCSACLAYERRPTIDWDARKAELLALLERHRWRQHSGSGHDCIVPSSGGKDSHYQVLTLLELGAKPLVVTASTCMLTPIGRKNIDNLARYANTIEVTPDRTVRGKLCRLGLQMVGDPSWPQHASIWSIPFQVAVNLNIPLIMWGENSQAEYGGPPGSQEARQMTRRWVSEFGGFNGLRPADFVGVEGITAQNMESYTLPGDDDLKRVGVEAHFLGAYIPWDSHRNAHVACEHGMRKALPCRACWWDFENLDCMITAIHDFFCFLKFGYGRLAAQISVDIRQGIIGRTEALEVVREDDGAFPGHYLGVSIQRALEFMGLTQDTFLDACNQFMNGELFIEQTVEWGSRLTLREFA